KRAEPCGGGRQTNGIVTPWGLLQERVQDRKDRAGHLGMKEVGGVKGGQTAPGYLVRWIAAWLKLPYTRLDGSNGRIRSLGSGLFHFEFQVSGSGIAEAIRVLERILLS